MAKLLCIIEVSGQNFIKSEVKVKVKMKFILEQATKTQRGSGDVALLFL
jgi:hypothetical protein